MLTRPLTITLLAVAVAGAGPAWSYDTAMAETAAPDTEASTTDNPETSKLIPGKGMMRCGGRHGKGQGGMMHGGGRHGKGQGSMMHGGGRHDKGSHDNDRQVAQRLDMIEARMAKIEAMLETLIRR